MTASNQIAPDHSDAPQEPSGESATQVYPPATAEIAEHRKQLAPGTHDAFQEFSKRVFEAGALGAKNKQLIAVAVAHTTQCPYCIRAHTKAALHRGASEQELMEAIWVAAEMRAGGAYAHSTLALETATHMGKASRPADAKHVAGHNRAAPAPSTT